ncbi:AAA family ATPase [Candidatus Chloroploca asiatica]|uniref:Nuclease SbcCD subunit C n=1 Tax=Candidatus Chloroploca asiatica TaxID=1506545 RepID=A0A2H3KN00_9CHLR|nr:SMC family ATPase [Candidatus Chloroploca asiatica]PDV99521.1 hypothetical protein A9Q02_12075 [Candidatus Chloroploca asiatica]
MIPTRLTLNNFMCYRANGATAGPPALDFDGLHVVCLTGENGAGKSTLLDAITWALWGTARMPDDDLIAQGCSEMSVELEFLLGDQRYRVSRRRQRGGTGKRGGQTSGKTQLDLQVTGPQGWRPIAETSVRETQALIEGLLRMSYQTFINASFLLQGRADEFTARTPAERKQVLAEILDLGEYAVLEGRAKERARALADQLMSLRGSIEQLNLEAERAPFWQLEVEHAERRVQAIEERVQQVELEYQRATERRRVLEQQAERRKEVLRRLEELRAAQHERETTLTRLHTAIQSAETLLAQREAILAGLAELAASRDEVERLDGLREQWQQLEDRRKELQQELREATHALRSRAERAAERRDGLRQRAARQRELEADLARLTLEFEALAPLEAAKQARLAVRETVDATLNQLRELQLRANDLQSAFVRETERLTGARDEQARLVARLDKQLRDEARWRNDLVAAQEAAAQVATLEATLSQMRQEERAAADHASEQRAERTRLKAAADKLKKTQEMLQDGTEVCPVCQSNLGTAGLARVHTHYEDELKLLREQYAAAGQAATAADHQMQSLRDDVARLEDQLDRLRTIAARADSLAQQVAQAERWHEERTTHQQACADFEVQLTAGTYASAIQQERNDVEQAMHALGDAAAMTAQRQQLAKELQELEQQLQVRSRLHGEINARHTSFEELSRDLASLPELEAEAAELARQIEQGDFAHGIRHEGRQITNERDALGYSPEAHNDAREQSRVLRHWEEDARRLAVAEESLARDTMLRQQTEELRARDASQIEQLIGEDALLAEALRELPIVTARAVELQTSVTSARRDLTVAQHDLGEKRGYLKQAEAAAAQLVHQRATEQALGERQSLFAELAEAFGKKGVQAMLIETAIPQIEDEANRLLARMTNGQMHLSFEMQRDTKKGDTVETLEIKLADALGTRVYDAFSGGEAMRANFAIRIALSRLLAHRAGARLETLVIDEGFGTLDAEGRERMVEAITSVQDDFRRIIVITHIDELKDRFPAQIEITKTPAGSYWELR